MIKYITDARFRQIVDTYGAVPAHWPDDERDAAIAASAWPDNSLLLREAAELDELLASHEVRLPGAATIHRIAATASRSHLRWSFSWLQTATFAGTGLAGIVLGALVTPAVVDGSSAMENGSYAMTYDITLPQELS